MISVIWSKRFHITFKREWCYSKKSTDLSAVCSVVFTLLSLYSDWLFLRSYEVILMSFQVLHNIHCRRVLRLTCIWTEQATMFHFILNPLLEISLVLFLLPFSLADSVFLWLNWAKAKKCYMWKACFCSVVTKTYGCSSKLYSGWHLRSSTLSGMEVQHIYSWLTYVKFAVVVLII